MLDYFGVFKDGARAIVVATIFLVDAGCIGIIADRAWTHVVRVWYAKVVIEAVING